MDLTAFFTAGTFIASHSTAFAGMRNLSDRLSQSFGGFRQWRSTNGYAFWRNAERRIDYAALDRIQQRSKGSRKKYSPR
jgi:hypothetical protein